MAIALLTFVAVFTLIASVGILVVDREKKPQIANVLLTPEQRRGLSGSLKQAGASIGSLAEHFEGVVPRTQAEISVMQQRMIRAGYRGESAVKIFYGAKFLVMMLFLVLSLVTGLASLNYFFVILLALALGFLAPDFWLGRRIKSRQREIRLGLPDVLDLLVVCVEAGLSLDHATVRTTDEMGRSHQAISDELGVVVLEQRAGCPRADAWRHLADRTDVESVRNVVSMLVQSEQFGTSIAKTLRVHSQTLRTQRIQQVEEQAAKTGIKILFPLVLCIFPNLFLVTLGPAIMLMMDSLRENFNH
jgi:tight adherence protein C